MSRLVSLESSIPHDMARYLLKLGPMLKRNFIIKSYFGLIIAFLLMLWPIQTGAIEKQIIGWIETVKIYPGGIPVKAKIDTGARHSSLNAVDLEAFEREGRQWVRFDFTNRQGKTTRIESQVLRMARIKRHDGRIQKRPVILLGICMGGTYRETQVNLIDRTGLNYQMLIGRSFIADSLIVDASRTFVTRPSCTEADRR